jgi:PAS domain S-box-containing protein
MKFSGVPIKRKIMTAIMATTVTVLLLTVAAFMIYDLVTVRDAMARNLSTLAQVVADNTGAALAFRNEKDAEEVLSSLHVEPQITAVALFDKDGALFVRYPADAPTNAFQNFPEGSGHRFEGGHLLLFEPVNQEGARLGTLCLQADQRLFYQRLQIYVAISALILLGSAAVALALSHRLQKRVSEPILMLAETARRVSQLRDYSTRVPAFSDDELGALSGAFNQMLTRIEEQTVAIQESAQRLRLALEASRTGTWDWNMISGRITWDDYNSALFGLKPGEFLGSYEHFLGMIHREDREAMEKTLNQALAEKKQFSFEFRVVWPAGSVHDMAAQGKAFYDAQGKPVRMTGVTQDITERKQIEAASRRLAAIVEFSDDAVISKDLNGIIMTWNAGAERLFGYPAAETIGNSIMIVIPSDRQEEERMILDRIRRGESIDHYETIRQRKDGTQIDISLTVSPIRNEQGVVIGASKIARDITEVSRARASLENQARMLREQAQMLDLANVMARELDDRIFLWNTGMEKMYGWLRTETLGRKAADVLQTRFPRPLDEIREILMREGQWEGELVHTRKDGRPITVASIWVLHRDPEGRPAAVIEVNSDITERKQAEQQMLRMNVELEQRVRERTAALTAANQELEAFTYSVAHDLRAPLRHIDAFTKIIFDDFAGEIPAEAHRYLENIRKGSQNMSRLVDDLLNLARVGRQELKHEIIPLNPVVDEVIAELKRETEHRRVEWRIGRLPSVASDPGLVKQIFANLLSNAVKYTRPRPDTVIEIGQEHINGHTAIFVRDNGVGFNMKYADKLFGVFQRLHRSDEFEGTGVGLATVDRIVRKHGGRIWAESEVNHGATFYFTLNGLDEAVSANGRVELKAHS